jgi:hypothetical protein
MKKLILLLAAFYCTSVFTQDEIWHSVDGKTITATLSQFEPLTDTAHFLINQKDYPVPLAKLTSEDQQRVKNWHHQQLKKIADHSIQESEKIKKLVGFQKEFQLTHRYFSTPDSYLQFYESAAYFQFHKIYDMTESKSLQAASFSIEGQKATLYVPEYQNKPYGVFIYISHKDEGWEPNEAYQEILKKHNLIMLSPHQAGNKEDVFRRIALALDSLKTIQLSLPTNPKFYFIGGTSGGGALATHLSINFPNIFKGVHCAVRGMLLWDVPQELPYRNKPVQPNAVFYSNLGYMNKSQLKNLAKKEQASCKFAFITGTNDYNYEIVTKSAPQWLECGFQTKLYDIPQHNHALTPAKEFDEIISWFHQP